MCGIIGLYGSGAMLWPQARKSFMLEGLIADSVRGYDSTGIALLPRKKEDHVQMYKRDLAGYDFVQTKHANRLLDGLKDGLGMIGHNRSATKGVVNDRNAHPFRYDHITLVHNGTIYNAPTLVDVKDRPNGISVDSEYVAHALSMEEPADVLPKLNGGYSLVWFNAEEQSLNFARNDQKPMFLAFDSENECVYFASEASLIVWLCDRNNLNIQSDIFRLTPHVHYSIKDPSKVKEITKVPFVYGQGHKAPSNPGPTPAREPWSPTLSQTSPQKKSPSGEPTPDTKDQPTTKTSGNDEDDDRSLLQRAGGEESSDSGKKATYARETLTPGTAAGIRKEAKGKRLEDLTALLAKHSLKPGILTAKPLAWFSYQTHEGQTENKHGWMICESTKPEAKDLFFQVFHISYKQWQDEYRDSLLYLEAVNFRKGKEPDQIVCRIREDLQKKHRKLGKDSQSGENQNGFGLMESGSKENWIEIGTSNKRLVHPFVYVQKTQNGCYNCNGALPSDSSEIMWVGVNDDRPVCDTCCNNPVILDAMQYVQ
jgi:predicted glutamine amidotransferase